MMSQSPLLTDGPVGPYPNRLQHRELVPGLCTAVEQTEWERLHRPASASASASTSAVSELSHPQCQAVTEADRAALQAAEQKAEAVAQMTADVAARTQRALEVMESSGIPVARVDEERGEHMRDVFHAACDGDVAMLEASLRPPTGNATADINAIGQPNPKYYKGTQFEKRWLFAAPPLVFAAAFNRERAVAALVAWGADVHATATTGLTAKQYAQQRGYAEVVRILEAAERVGEG